MFVAGVATLAQSLGLGPIGARAPIVMGTSFGFVPVILPIAISHGLPAVLGAALIGGLAMALVGLTVMVAAIVRRRGDVDALIWLRFVVLVLIAWTASFTYFEMGKYWRFSARPRMGSR